MGWVALLQFLHMEGKPEYYELYLCYFHHRTSSRKCKVSENTNNAQPNCFAQINLKSNYLEGTATEIDPKAKTIACESVVCEGNSCEINDFTVEYDKLIVTVGAQTNTYGIPGVREHCCFLKQVEDARRIRTAIVNLFERANLPGLTDEQCKAILTFAVIGAGPTGVEFAR